MRPTRPLLGVLYGALILLCLVSYAEPIGQIFESRGEISTLEDQLREAEAEHTYQQRAVESLQNPEGIERTARERYGMVRPEEQVYIVPEAEEAEEPPEDSLDSPTTAAPDPVAPTP